MQHQSIDAVKSRLANYVSSGYYIPFFTKLLHTACFKVAVENTLTCKNILSVRLIAITCNTPLQLSSKKGKGSPYSITERRVPELIPVLGSHPTGDVSHKPGGRLPLLSARPAVTLATLKRAATNFAAW